MMIEPISLQGNLLIRVLDPRTGKELDRREIHNLVVTAGKNLIAAMLVGSASRPTHIAVGTSATAAAAGDIALVGTEVARVSVSVSNSGAVATFYGYFPSSVGNGNTWKEAGLFNASSAGTMLARATYADIVKTNLIVMTMTWQVTIS